MDFMMPVSTDFLMSDRLLMPGTSLTVKLIRNPDSITIMSPDAAPAWKVDIIKMQLHMRLVDLAPEVLSAHLSAWKSRPAIMPINRTTVSYYNQSHAVASVNIQNLFTGRLPKTIIIGMVRATAYSGAYNLNPFHFRHFNLDSASLKVNGDNVPTEPYKPNFADGLYMREYRSLFENTGIHHDNLGTSVTYEQFAGGSFLQVYDLSPDKCNGFHFHGARNGNIELNMTFSQALVNPITILVYASYDSEVLLHSDGQVTVVYSDQIVTGGKRK
jgi:hypothetical protein